MIIRKPYAFIIKHFRALHIITLGVLLYITYTISNISGLVNQLIRSRTYMYEGAETYINKTVYLVILIGFALVFIMYWILKEKNKPIGLYMGLVIYLGATTIFFLYCYAILGQVVKKAVEPDVLSFMRDIIVLVRYPGYVFIILCLIRGIGFNVKQFNFSKDIQELKIADQDSEEFELIVGQNNYKYARLIRKTIRETKYYIMENTIALMALVAVVVVILGFFGVKYYNQFVKKIKSQDITSVDGIYFAVNDAYITAEDINGNIIKEGSKFVIVDMNFSNGGTEDKAVNLDIITLANGKLLYHPTQSYNSKFFDLGQPYEKGYKVPADSMVNGYIVFEIPTSVTTTNYTLKIEYGLQNKENKVVSLHKKIAVKAKNIDVEDKREDINIDDTINTDVNNENKFSIRINDYKLQENYNYKYVICEKDLTCQSFYNLITANKYDASTMMVVSYDAVMYADAKFTKTFNSYNKVFANYAFLEYIYQGRIYDEKLNLVPQSEVQEKAFIIVNRRILNATRINLIFKFRNNTYNVALKG